MLRSVSSKLLTRNTALRSTVPSPHTAFAMSGSDDSIHDVLVRQLKNGPPSNCRAEQIDFKEAGIPGYAGKFAMLIHNLFTPEECQMLVRAAEETNKGEWEQALVNVGGGQQKLIVDQRLCGRILWDSFEVAQLLENRVKPLLPSDIATLHNRADITGNGPVKRKETWSLSRFNERLRFLKYTKGMYFREHCDGCYATPDGEEHSRLTVHIYLNGPALTEVEQDNVEQGATDTLIGGATRFSTWNGEKGGKFDVDPQTGSCLVFQQRLLMHSGEEVEQGTKYTLRTDVMYKKVDNCGESGEKQSS